MTEDALAGTSPSPAWINVRDFVDPALPGAEIGLAIEALPESGGFVYVPPGRYFVPSPGIAIDKRNVTLLGDGCESSVISRGSSAIYPLLTINHGLCRIYNLGFDGVAATETPGDVACVRFNGFAHTGMLNAHCYMENVKIINFPGIGLLLSDVLLFVAVNCEFIQNKTHGARVLTPPPPAGGSTTVRFIGCAFSYNEGSGIVIARVGTLSLIGCTLEGNRGGALPGEGRAIQALTADNLQVSGCYIETGTFEPPIEPPGPAEQFVRIQDSLGVVIDTCYINNGELASAKAKRAAMFVASPGCRFTSNLGNKFPADDPAAMLAEFDVDSARSVVFGNFEVGQVVQEHARVIVHAKPDLSRNAWTNVLDFASIQEALDVVAAGGGGAVFVPEGVYDDASRPSFVAPLVLPANVPIRLIGAGAGATRLRSGASADLILIRGDHQSVECLTLEYTGPGGPTANKSAIKIGRGTQEGATGIPVFRPAVIDCVVEGFDRWGIYCLDDGNGDPATDGALVRVVIRKAEGGGAAARLGIGSARWSLRDVKSVVGDTADHLELQGCSDIEFDHGVFVTTDNAFWTGRARLTDVVAVRFGSCEFRDEGYGELRPLMSWFGTANAGVALAGCRFKRAAVPTVTPVADLSVAHPQNDIVAGLLIMNAVFEKPPDDPLVPLVEVEVLSEYSEVQRKPSGIPCSGG